MDDTVSRLFNQSEDIKVKFSTPAPPTA
jgi:hypothetical protein